MSEQYENDEIFTLTDEDGNVNEFVLLGQTEMDGEEYLALEPLSENPDGEYVILKLSEENGEQILITIEDDDEFDRVADYFDDELFGEIDHDM